MPSINNYTFSEPVFNIPEESNIVTLVGATAVITITPNTGFTATAGDFSATSFNATYISNVAFTQSGNNVLCTMTLINTTTMPSSNLTLGLCVSGSAVEKLITIGGKYSAIVGSNVTGDSSETNVVYSASGAISTVSSLFTKTYNAATGYFWGGSSIPSINIVKGNQKHYSIVQTPTFDASNRLTNIAYAVSYQFPDKDVSGDEIFINVPSTQEIYVPTSKITGYLFNTSVIGNPAEIRKLTILGNPGTVFGATLNDGATTTVIINNQSLDANGRFEQDISFPILVKGDPNVTYQIELTGANVSTLALPNPFTVLQLNEVTISIKDLFPPTPLAGWTDLNTTIPALNPTPFAEGYTDPLGNEPVNGGIWTMYFDYNLTAINGSNLTLIRQIDPSADFVDLNGNVMITEDTPIETKANGTQSSNVLNVDNTTGIIAGDSVALQSNLAPYVTTVSSVDSLTQITLASSVSVVDDQNIQFYRDGGNKLEIFNSLCTQVDAQTINVRFGVGVDRSGIESKVFYLKLNNIIS